MLHNYFSKELIKIANPQILRHLNSYDPDSAKAALQDEFGMLMKALKRQDLPMEAQIAIRRRIDDLNRVDYLIDSYKKSYNKKGNLESPKMHIVKGLQEKIDDLTREQRSALSRQVLEGKTTKQNVEIAMKHRVREHVPVGVTKEYAENIEGFLGLSDDPKFSIYKKDNEIAKQYLEQPEQSTPPEEPPAAEQNPPPEEPQVKEANIKPIMMPVAGSKGRDTSGLAKAKKIGSASSVAKTIIPKKLFKSLVSADKKSVGSLSNIGSSPKALGMMKKARAKKPSLKAPFLSMNYSSKKKIKKPPSVKTLNPKVFPFKTKSLKESTNMSKYLKLRGYKSTV